MGQPDEEEHWALPTFYTPSRCWSACAGGRPGPCYAKREFLRHWVDHQTLREPAQARRPGQIGRPRVRWQSFTGSDSTAMVERRMPELPGGTAVYKRFARWSDRGIWELLHQHLADDAIQWCHRPYHPRALWPVQRGDAGSGYPDLEYLSIDSTVVRAHPCAAGVPPQRVAKQAQALGRSRGGFSTKVHVSVDSLGNPLRFILTGGQQHDITQAEELIDGYEGEYVLADKGYDSQGFRQHILERGMTPVIPPRSNRKQPCDYDAH